MAPIIAAWEYFPNRKGTVVGLILLGGGSGSLIFGFISLAIANPENEQATFDVKGGKIFAPDSPISERAPEMIRYNWAVWCLLLLISLPMMSSKRVQENNIELRNEMNSINPSHTQLLNEEDDAISINEKEKDNTLNEPTLKEALLDYRTTMIWVMMTWSAWFPLYIASNFKTYEEKDVHDDHFITLVGSISWIFNGISRSIFSLMIDFTGFKSVYLFILVFQIIVSFTLEAIHKTKILYMIWVWYSFASVGGHYAIFLTLSAKIYGPITGSKIYAFLNSAFSVSFLISWFVNLKSENAVYILSFIQIISLILLACLSEKPKISRKDQKIILQDDKSIALILRFN